MKTILAILTAYVSWVPFSHAEDHCPVCQGAVLDIEPHKGDGQAFVRAAVTKKTEQTGAGQPATQPADKAPAKDQPPTPTSKVNPR